MPEIEKAYTLIEHMIETMLDLQEAVASNQSLVGDATRSLSSMKLYWQGVDQNGTDMPNLAELSAQVAIDQGILQTASQLVAKIHSLSLSSFLSISVT